jgi:hypothetical protein
MGVLSQSMAERVGFEPTVPENWHNGFRGRRLQPLGHLSGANAVIVSDGPAECLRSDDNVAILAYNAGMGLLHLPEGQGDHKAGEQDADMTAPCSTGAGDSW